MSRRIAHIVRVAAFFSLAYVILVAALVDSALTPPGASVPACTTPGAARRATPTVPVFIPGDGFRRPAPTPSPTPVPQPVNPVEKRCDDDRVRVLVSNPQQFAHHIGEIIEINISIWVDPAVTVDFQSLKSGVLKFDGTTAFRLAADRPLQIFTTQDNGQTLYTVMLRVQTFVPRQTVPFSLDLRYAINQAADARTNGDTLTSGSFDSPDWKILTTPDYVVTTSRTLDNGTQILPGNMEPAVIATPPAVRTLLLASLICAAACSTAYIREALQRLRRIPTTALYGYTWMWEMLERQLAQCNSEGFDRADMRRLAKWIRAALHIEACTPDEVEQIYRNDSRLPSIKAALAIFERFLYDPSAPARLDQEEQGRLIKSLREIVRKPK